MRAGNTAPRRPATPTFAWLQHFVYHLSPTGIAGVVLAKGALTSKTSGEGDIRKAPDQQRQPDRLHRQPARQIVFEYANSGNAVVYESESHGNGYWGTYGSNRRGK
jgi:hypothetical protein